MKNKTHSLPVLLLGVILLLIVLVWAVCIPNFIHGGPSTISRIINNLRQIQAAKEQWAFESHETKDIAVPREIVDSLFRPSGSSYGAVVKPIAGERYTINTLWKSAEAELTKGVDRYPRGTVVRLGTNMLAEIILPKFKQPSGS